MSFLEKNWFFLKRNQETMIKSEPKTESPPEILSIHCNVGNVMKMVFDGMIGGSIDGEGGIAGDGEGGGDVPFAVRSESVLNIVILIVFGLFFFQFRSVQIHAQAQ